MLICHVTWNTLIFLWPYFGDISYRKGWSRGNWRFMRRRPMPRRWTLRQPQWSSLLTQMRRKRKTLIRLWLSKMIPSLLLLSLEVSYVFSPVQVGRYFFPVLLSLRLTARHKMCPIMWTQLLLQFLSDLFETLQVVCLGLKCVHDICL